MEVVEQINKENNIVSNEPNGQDLKKNLYMFNLEFDIKNQKYAESLCKIMNVDEEFGPGEIQRSFTAQGTKVYLQFSSKEPKKIRVAVSSFLENMQLVLETINQYPNPK